MSHRTRGLYRFLELPRVYEQLQKLLGAQTARTRFVEEFVRPFAGARVLDAGCGTGALLEYLPPDADYTGFDLNPAYIEAARTRHGRRGRFFVARVGEELGDIGAGCFDIVVAKALLHHLTDGEAAQLLRMSARALAPDGVFVSYDNVFYDGQPWFSRALTALDRGGSVRTPEGYRALASPYFASIETTLLTDMLRVPYAHFVMRARKQ
jgi:SAM-dependent methyltransferase